MTTLFGIMTDERDAVVLGADSQLNFMDDNYEELDEKISNFNKITVGRKWAAAIAGIDNRRVYDFKRKLRGEIKGSKEIYGGIETEQMLEQAIKRQKEGDLISFVELCRLNALLRKENVESDDLIEILLAIQTPLGLWHVNEFGTFLKPPDNRDIKYLCLGTGSKKIDEYMDRGIYSEKDINPNIVDLKTAIEITYRALCQATRDPYTGKPFSFVIVTSQRIDDFSEEMKTHLERAERSFIDDIIKARYQS